MRLMFVVLVLVGTTCNGQEPDTLIYIDRAEHEAAMAEKQETIDSLQNLLDLCRELLVVKDVDVIADTFNVSIVDDRIKVSIKKEGYKVWYDLEDGYKRINADYTDYERKVMLMDSTHTVGSLYIR